MFSIKNDADLFSVIFAYSMGGSCERLGRQNRGVLYRQGLLEIFYFAAIEGEQNYKSQASGLAKHTAPKA